MRVHAFDAFTHCASQDRAVNVSGNSTAGRVASVPAFHSFSGGFYARCPQKFLRKNANFFLQVIEKNVILATSGYGF